MKTTSFQGLIDLVGELSADQRDALAAALRHVDDGAQAMELIDASFAEKPRCGHCGALETRKWGQASNLKRYRCKSCGRTFNALTGTKLAYLKKRGALAAYAQSMVDGASLRKAAARTGLNLGTSFNWRHRFLAAPKEKTADKLSGVVEADEIFF